MKQKGHHYITESYQRNFADKNGHVWILTPEKKIFNTDPENSFKESYFYNVKLPSGGGSLFVEKTLAQIEGEFINVFNNKIIYRENLSGEDRGYLSLFVAAMITRTKVQRDHFRDSYNKLIEHMDMMKKAVENNPKYKPPILTPSNGPSATLGELKEHMENFDSHESVSTLSLLKDTAPLISEMKWSIFVSEDGKNFISSDNPFCMCSPTREKLYGRRAFGANVGLLDRDVEITFPLSKKFALFASWENPLPLYVDVNQTMVKQINYRTCRTASNLIASSKQELEKIIEKIN